MYIYLDNLTLHNKQTLQLVPDIKLDGSQHTRRVTTPSS